MTNSQEKVARTNQSTVIRREGSLQLERSRELLVKRPLRAAYDRDGAVARETLRIWGPGEQPADVVPHRLDDHKHVESCDQEVIWGGYLSTHYGHFLTESVSRLWPVLPGAALHGQPVVFVGPRQRPSFMNEWLRAFGVQLVELPPNEVVLFRRMAVAEPAWRLNAWIAPEVRSIHLNARQQMTVPSLEEREVLWLSRLGLGLGRASHDERLLEWILRDHVCSVWPETLSLPEQIGMIEGSRAVAGIVGSAFHSLLLAEATPRCLILCPGTVASAYVAQAQLTGTESSFVQALEPVPVKDRSQVRFPAGYRLMIPEALRALIQILPGLSDSPEIESILEPRAMNSPKATSSHSGLFDAIATVAHNPHSATARLALGERFRAEGEDQCAAEQFRLVAEMSDKCRAAR